MSAITVPPFAPFQPMPPTPSHGNLNGHNNEASPGPAQPSQPIQSQRLLSQMLPDVGPSQPGASYAPARAPRLSTSPSSSTSSRRDSAHHASPLPPPQHLTPLKSSLRLSHPPPAPSSSYLQQITPQSKRVRLNNHDTTDSATIAATSPFSHTSSAYYHSATGSAATGPLSSPSLPSVRPLSGISRPLPVPPTPSRPHRLPSPSTRNGPLIPMPQCSIEDFQKLLPQRQPPAHHTPRPNGPQRALLQAIPPQPRAQIPASRNAEPLDLGPMAPATETLPQRRNWSRTGFRSFDLDVDRIAKVVQLEDTRLLPQESDQNQDRVASQNLACTYTPHFGHPDRGLPSGSILEVLGPPGSGKSSLILQFAVTERLRALRRARLSLSVTDDEDASGCEPDNEDSSKYADSCFFTEEFWDAEVASADQILLLDCEGALSPERVSDAAWSAVSALWKALRGQLPTTDGTDGQRPSVLSANSPMQQERSAMPEEVRRLVAAVLAGIHVSRVTSLAGLIALLHSIRPTDELQEGQSRKAIPTALPARTSLIAIDSLSYYLRSGGGSNQDRKVADRIRDMLIRIQKPFEHRPPSESSAETRQATRQKCVEAAEKLCAPTIVFSNQLGIRRGRNDSEASGRASPSRRPFMGAGPSRSLQRGNGRSEGSSILAPLLNGPRPPQPARVRDERPPPSVALCGPEMWDEDEQPTSSPRQRGQPLAGGRNVATQPMGHDRGWPPSFLGQDVWRILLFRHGTFGSRYAQMASVPPTVQSELSGLWTQTRERVNARARARLAAATGPPEQRTQGEAEMPAPQQPTEAPPNDPVQMGAATSISAARQASDEDERDKQMLELLSQLRASLFRWRPFHITTFGLAS